MIQKILESVEDQTVQSSDLAIDELADLFESSHLSEAVKTQTILRLLQTVKKEENPAVIESIYNLFDIAFSENICINEIVERCIDMLDILEPGSLAHALPIIADSNLKNRKELIINYLGSENPAIKKIAKELLTQIR